MSFSKVASKIGVSLAVDSQTTAKSLITFARICIQRLIKEHNLDLICLLKTKLNVEVYHSSCNVRFFPNEKIYNNFHCLIGERILMKWNSDTLSFTPSHCSPQFIHVSINMKQVGSFLLTCIYVHNDAYERQELWNSITSLSKEIDAPWILVGDFNCVLLSSKKSEGNALPISQLSNFKSCVEMFCMMELSSSGLLYTWSNL